MIRLHELSLALIVTVCQQLQAQPAEQPKNPLVTALAFTHQCAKPEALKAEKSRQLESALIKSALRKSMITWDELSEFLHEASFLKLSGGKKQLTIIELEKIVHENWPDTRKALNTKLRVHAELLSTQFDMIDVIHREPADQLASWIAKNHHPEKTLSVIVICTGNSRRSILGSTMGNFAAAYHGFPNVRFYSGGTHPTAFNPRTIAALKEIGMEIEPSGKEAERGPAGDANPIYQIQMGKDLKFVEFSKKYSDRGNPQQDFAAILVCSEADQSCPKVAGASIRIPVPYMDPKSFDGAVIESAKYAERRDDIGRLMLNVLLQARRRIDIQTAQK